VVQRFYWKVNIHPVGPKIPSFHGTRRFIIVFAKAFYVTTSWAGRIQFTTSHPVSHKIPFNIILSSMPRSPKCTLIFSFSDLNSATWIQSTTSRPISHKIRFNIILSSSPRSTKCTLIFSFTDLNSATWIQSTISHPISRKIRFNIIL